MSHLSPKQRALIVEPRCELYSWLGSSATVAETEKPPDLGGFLFSTCATESRVAFFNRDEKEVASE